MKTTALILLSYFAIPGASQAQPLDASTLSLHSPVPCRGAGRPAARTRNTVHAEIAGAPASNLDLNGDGWCDWITSLPYPTNAQDQEYGARDAIDKKPDQPLEIFVCAPWVTTTILRAEHDGAGIK